MSEYASQYAALGLFFALNAGLVVIFLTLTSVLGPKLRFPEKQEPFECGEHQLGSPYQRLNVKFYMVAVSFIIFDVEMVFLYPWAVAFRDLGWFGFWTMLVFVALLAIGLAYEWLKGGLDWN
jgi:NADH-quinone oxidoreductase subunit A